MLIIISPCGARKRKLKQCRVYLPLKLHFGLQPLEGFKVAYGGENPVELHLRAENLRLKLCQGQHQEGWTAKSAAVTANNTEHLT